MPKFLNSFFWFLILIIFSFGIAFFCVIMYIIVYTLSACISGLKAFDDYLLEGIRFPHTCISNMIKGRPLSYHRQGQPSKNAPNPAKRPEEVKSKVERLSVTNAEKKSHLLRPEPETKSKVGKPDIKPPPPPSTKEEKTKPAAEETKIN